MIYYNIQCPCCGHIGDESEDSFDMSLANECWCPVCGEDFQVWFEDEDEDE